MVPSRRRLARTLTIIALIAIVPAGCGSSDDETSRTSTVSGGGPATSPDSSVAETGKRKTAKSGQQGKDPDQGGSKADQVKTGMSEPPKKEQSRQAGGHQGGNEDSVCPGGMTRAECKKRIEAETTGAQEPGKVVSDPSDCTEVMSEEQCEEIVRAQKAAEGQAGKSVSPQTCLEEYSREFCEERFGQQAEQQQAGR